MIAKLILRYTGLAASIFAILAIAYDLIFPHPLHGQSVHSIHNIHSTWTFLLLIGLVLGALSMGAKLLSKPLAGPLLALALIFIAFTLLVPDWRDSASLDEQLTHFNNIENICNIFSQTSMVAVAALGMTFIIIAGGIDLSAGSLAALSCVLIAVVLKSGTPEGWHLANSPALWALLAACVGLFVGLLAGGALNGTLVTGLGVVPFIITLGTMMIFRGTAKYFANQANVSTPDNWLYFLLAHPDDNTAWMIFPPAVWFTLLLAIFMTLVLNYSRFGRQAIAVGSNENTARLCGIPVARTKLLVYMLGGLFTGIAGLFFYSRLRQGNPTSAEAFELDVIAAVVIGGASLSGGKGSIFGSLIGALILNVIARGCSQIHIPDFLQRNIPSIFTSSTGLPTYVQQFVTGCIIITAAFIDRLRQRRTGA